MHLEPITAPAVPNTDDWLSVRRLCVCFPVRYATQLYFHSSPELGLLYVCAVHVAIGASVDPLQLTNYFKSPAGIC